MKLEKDEAFACACSLSLNKSDDYENDTYKNNGHLIIPIVCGVTCSDCGQV